MKMAVANILYHHDNVIDKRSFANTFGLEFSDLFRDEISALQEMNMVEEDESEFRLVCKDNLESIAAQKFFWDASYLKRQYGVG